VDILTNPGTTQDVYTQAMNFIHEIRASPDGWQPCLSLFVRNPQPSEAVRIVGLDVILGAINARINNPTDESLQYIKQVLFEYVQTSYGPGASSTDSGAIKNKLSQTFTLLFIATYVTSWQSFFDDLMALGKSAPGGPWDNPDGIDFFLRTSSSVHDDVADTLTPRTPQESQRNIYIKDCVRERDMHKLVTSWQEILEEFKGKSDLIVESGLGVIARWVSWIDISLVVNEVMMRQLFHFMDCGGKIRNAALAALTEIVGKKMKGPDKLDLISFLNVGEIVNQICQSVPLRDQNTMEYDTDLAEGTAKLVNTTTMDIVMILKV
jgi:exportin-T